MFASNSKIPCRIRFFLMVCKPSNDNSQLFAWKSPRQKLSVNSNRSFIFTIIYVDMRFIMLSCVAK